MTKIFHCIMIKVNIGGKRILTFLGHVCLYPLPCVLSHKETRIPTPTECKIKLDHNARNILVSHTQYSTELVAIIIPPHICLLVTESTQRFNRCLLSCKLKTATVDLIKITSWDVYIKLEWCPVNLTLSIQ